MCIVMMRLYLLITFFLCSHCLAFSEKSVLNHGDAIVMKFDDALQHSVDVASSGLSAKRTSLDVIGVCRAYSAVNDQRVHADAIVIHDINLNDSLDSENGASAVMFKQSDAGIVTEGDLSKFVRKLHEE